MFIPLSAYVFAASDTAKAGYLHDFGVRLVSNGERLGWSLAAAAIAIGIAITTRSTLVKVMSVFAAVGAFWWGWWLYNSFANPPHPVALLGQKSLINQTSDLFSGWGVVWFAVALLLSVVALRVGHGLGGFLAAFSVFTGVIILVNLISNLSAL